jgi:hypothetical protein
LAAQLSAAFTVGLSENASPLLKESEMKDGMKGSMKREAPMAPKRGDSKSGHWDGGGGLGTKGGRWEGTGKHCRGEAAKRGFGKS